MARITKGILGGVSGTVGTVVGGNWNGIEYIRSKAARHTNANTPEQQLQRAKFKLMTSFLATIKDLVKFSFKEFAILMTGRNHAFAYNIKNAVTGTYPNFTLDYPMILVSRGSLRNTEASPAVSNAPGKIDFSWLDNSGAGSAKDTDKAILVAYCPQLDQSVYTSAGAVRSAGADSLNVPAFAGKQVHTWFAFISDKGKDVATSVYTGMVTVQ